MSQWGRTRAGSLTSHSSIVSSSRDTTECNDFIAKYNCLSLLLPEQVLSQVQLTRIRLLVAALLTLTWTAQVQLLLLALLQLLPHQSKLSLLPIHVSR